MRADNLLDLKDPATAFVYIVSLSTPAQRLRTAVKAATYAYQQSGRTGDAALVYAAYGLPIFPLTQRKTPIPARDRDANGKQIPGTGSFYKATCNPKIIEAWWQKNRNALIGLPMGKLTGVWTLDVDTAEDHADGLAEWNKLTAQHDPITTREHRSATDGPHLILNWDEYEPVHCSTGNLPAGIEVKGQGGYIVVPPSRRKGRAYTVYNDIDPVDAPKWLTDLILPKREQYNGAAQFNGAAHYGSPVTADLKELADAMQFIPNDDAAQPEYNSMGMRLWLATGGSDEGFELFDAWARRSKKYHGGTKERWRHYFGSPPDHTGAGKIFKIARANGWVPKPRIVEPTYPADEIYSVDEARSETQFYIHNSLEYIFAKRSGGDDIFAQCNEFLRCSTTHALRIPTGVGKTKIIIEQLSEWIRAGKVAGPIIYAVPRHKLGHEIEKQFAAYGIDAGVFRGRGAIDPEIPEKQMCRNLPAVELAMKCHADITATCCTFGRIKCRFFNECGYQRQLLNSPPSVWIVAGDMIFHTHKVFGDPVAVIIDEQIWTKGLRGIEPRQNNNSWEVALDSLLGPFRDHFDGGAVGERDYLRHQLAELLYLQEVNDGVERRHLDAFLSVDDCDRAIKLEWECHPPNLALLPGMSDGEIKKLAKNSDRIKEIQHARRVIKIWEAVRELLDNPEIAISGRLTLTQQNGQRCIEWRGVAPISEQFRVPTLLLDATLPDISILQVFHPTVEIVADIKAAMPPHVHIRQIMQAPTSSNKLKNEKHLDSVWRYILQRWFETERGPTLVICQEKVENWLKDSWLPDNISVEHFNDVAGIDKFKDVRLLILVGRTAPGPQAMEVLAAALSGAQPVQATAGPSGFAWYDRVKRGIRLPDGSGIESDGDQHPDHLAEAIRWQVHEGELVQAMGRGRAINRTAETPLAVDLLFNSCLPIVVNAVSLWKPPSLLIATAVEGVILTSAVDMVRLWPQLWPNEKAAHKAVKLGVPALPGFVPVAYQLAGPKMNRRLGYFNHTIIPDPIAWLQAQLGPLVFQADGGGTL